MALLERAALLDHAALVDHVALPARVALMDCAVPKDKQAFADHAARLVRLARTPEMG